jgi:hypothetical protein
MSIRVMSAVFECTTMTPSQKLVSLALADHCHDDGTEARPGMARLKAKTSLDERTIQRTIRTLLSGGYIVIQRAATPVSPNVYRFDLGGVMVTGGGVMTGGGTVTQGRGHSDARGVAPRHPNHHEPLLETTTTPIVDMVKVRERNDKALGRKR